jgi:predicted AAA+ superfamily ATPase
MAPTTRSKSRQTTPERQPKRREHDTIKKNRFYQAYDDRNATESLRSICRSIPLPESSGRFLLRQRELLGSLAYRKTRPQSENLGPGAKVSHDTFQMLVSTSNPVRTEPYEVQISHHNLPIKKRALQAGLKRHTKGGQRFKQAYIKKKISPTNLAARVKYGERYQHETIESFWQYIYYTDEAHIDPSSQGVGHILREEGTRYKAENIQQRPELKGVKLHIAGWVN